MKMNANREWRFILAACICLQLLPSSIESAGGRTKYQKEAFAAIAIFTFRKVRFMLAGFLSSSEFFEGLVRIETVTGYQFQKQKRIVGTFPETLAVHMRILPRESFPQEFYDEPFPPEAEDFVGNLRFDFQWKRGMELWPAEVLRGSIVLPVQRDWKGVWTYEFQIQSKDVPLTDHLIIVCRAKDGKSVSRLSARL